MAPLQQFVHPTLLHTREQPSSKILILYGTKELGIGATRCSGSLNFSSGNDSAVQGIGANVTTVDLTSILAYTVEDLYWY